MRSPPSATRRDRTIDVGCLNFPMRSRYTAGSHGQRVPDFGFLSLMDKINHGGLLTTLLEDS